MSNEAKCPFCGVDQGWWTLLDGAALQGETTCDSCGCAFHWDMEISVTTKRIVPTVTDFVKCHNVAMTWKPAAKNTHMDLGVPMHHYKVTLKRNGESMTTSYSKGVGHKGAPPDVVEVLDALRHDYYAAPLTFEDFCGELGYDTYSRKAYTIWLACQETSADMRQLFSTTELAELHDCEQE